MNGLTIRLKIAPPSEIKAIPRTFKDAEVVQLNLKVCTIIVQFILTYRFIERLPLNFYFYA